MQRPASLIPVLARVALLGLAASCSRTNVFESATDGTLVVTPSSARVAVGGSQAFEATLLRDGAAPQAPAVVWAVSPEGFGTITAEGVYTAPAALPDPAATQALVEITATLQAAANVSGTAAVTVVPEESGPAVRLERVTTTPLTGTVGQPVSPIRVKAVDASGRGVPTLAVTFESPLSPADAVVALTDGEGVAEGAPKAGAAAGAQSFAVTSGSLNTLVFAARIEPGSVARLEATHPTGRGQAGQALADPVTVQALDQFGNPVPGVALEGFVAGAGPARPRAATTDAGGSLAFDAVLAAQPGPQELTFSVPDLGISTTLVLEALGGPPATLELVSGDAQQGAVETDLAAPLVVRVLDALGIPSPDATVTWSIDGGTFASADAVTGTDGTAKALVHLGRRVGLVQVTVDAAPALPVVSFSARVGPGAPSRLQLVTGADQTTTAGLAFAASFGVRATDAFSNGVAGVPVRFEVTRGGGSVAPADVPTGADGLAQATLTAGTPGAQGYRASVAGLLGSPIDLTLAAIAPTRDVLAAVSGSGQSASVLAELSAPLVVRVTNNGQPAAGRVVTFGAAVGTGSVRPATVVTGADGTARAIATLGPQAGPQRFGASVPGATNSPVYFDATAAGRPVATLRLISGGGQSSSPGSTLATPFVLEALDDTGAPLPGAELTFEAPIGGATDVPAATTDAQGRATFLGTLGPGLGAQRFVARAGTISLDVVATATTEPGQSRMRASSGGGQQAEVGLALALPLEVLVVDEFGKPKAGVVVRWRGEAELARVDPPESTTDAQGLASTRATLGKTLGSQRFFAEATNVAGSPVAFAATGTVAPADHLVIASGDAQSALVGTALARPLVVRVVDRVGNPIVDVGVTFRAGPQGGTIAPTTLQRTNAQGEAQASATLSRQVGPHTFFADADALGSAAFTATATNTVARLSISPQATQVEEGASLRYVATAIYADGTAGTVTDEATWTSSAPAFATVSDAAGAKGIATAIAAGQTTVRAVYQGVIGETVLLVRAATLRQISILPADATVVRGSTRAFRAVGTWSNNAVNEVTETVAWTSSAPAVATVSNLAGTRGLVKGIAPGVTTLTAVKDGITGTREVTVSQAPLAALEITPANVVQPAGGAASFRATAAYQDGTLEDVTAVATWASSDTALMTLQNAPATPGRATFLAAGTPEVTATWGGVTARVKVTITQATVISLTIFPQRVDLSVHDFMQMRLIATYSDGTVSDAAQLATWTSDAPLVADVSNALGSRGNITAVSAGNARVTAAYGGQTASTDVRVDGATVARIRVQSSDRRCAAGQIVRMAALAVYSDRSEYDISDQVGWSSSDPSVAVVEQGAQLGGLVRCLKAGTVRITAAFGGQSDNANLTVTNAVLTSIEVGPASARLARGDTRPFFATGRYSDRTTADLTALVTWASSDQAILTVSNAPGAHGRAVGVAPGTVTASATLDGVTGSMSVTVTDATLLVLVVSPANPIIDANRPRLRFTAIAAYDDGVQTDVTDQVAWSTDNPAVAIISNDAGTIGTVLVNGSGTCHVTASYGGRTSTTTLTVR